MLLCCENPHHRLRWRSRPSPRRFRRGSRTIRLGRCGHANAVKEAETDPTARALTASFSRFGLALYDPKQNGVRHPSPARERTVRLEPRASRAAVPSGPQVGRGLAEIVPMLVPPVRRRDKQYLQLVGSHPCLVCDRTPSHALHGNFLQPRSMGPKVSDEYRAAVCDSPSRTGRLREGAELVDDYQTLTRRRMHSASGK